jgi:hypothetical protein
VEFNLDKIKSKVIFSIIGFLNAIAPGYILILVYDRKLFLQLDVFKLSILSISITLPMILLNTLFFLLMDATHRLYKGQEEREFITSDNLPLCILYGSGSSIVPYYVLIFSLVNYPLSPSVSSMIYTLGLSNSITLIIIFAANSGFKYLFIRFNNKKNQNSD